MEILRRTQFGDPILRTAARTLTEQEILSPEVHAFIRDMFYTAEKKKYGIGLAAPQVGKSIALAIVAIKPTPTRPKLTRQELVIINPQIVKTYGYRTGMWEGCISGTEIYAKAMRYKKIRLRYYDEKSKRHEQDFDGLLAQVIQHEVDHLQGILFVDRVKDTKTYMTFSEYNKMRRRAKIL